MMCVPKRHRRGTKGAFQQLLVSDFFTVGGLNLLAGTARDAHCFVGDSQLHLLY